MINTEEWVRALSPNVTGGSLPWVPVTEGYAPGAIAPLLALVLASTALIVALDCIESRAKREKLRRYCLARHRILRAGFYRFFKGG